MLNAGRPPEIRVDRPFLLYFEMTLYIILLFIALCAGMALSVYAFGTGGKRKRIFQDIYFSVEDTNGVGVLYTKTGEYSAILKIENPVQKYCANIDSYTSSRTFSPPSRRRSAKDMPCTNRTSSSGNSSRTRRGTNTSSSHRPTSVTSRGVTIRTACVT